MALGAQRSNMMTVPTDCDQRDERLGWMGDADLSSQSFMINYDAGNFLTMFMVPNLTLILDLKKPKHPPLKAFDVLVDIPVKRNRGVIGVFILMILLSATIGQANVEENIDLLGMAPEGESPVVKMKQYSREFEAGQVGMVLVNANVSGDFNDEDVSNDDPAKNTVVDHRRGLCVGNLCRRRAASQHGFIRAGQDQDFRQGEIPVPG